MYIPPLLLLVPEFAADYAEENNQLFDMICLRKYEKLDDAVGRIVGSGDGYVSRYAIGIVGSGWGNDGLMQSSRWIWRDRDCFDLWGDSGYGWGDASGSACDNANGRGAGKNGIG